APGQPPRARDLRRARARGRALLPERPHLLLGRHEPARGQALPRRARPRRLPLPRPRRVALAADRPLHPDPLPGRDGLPEAREVAAVRDSRQKIRVLIVDDSAFVRLALSRMLQGAPDMEVVGQAADGKEGVAKAAALKPDVVTLDIKMPKMGGLEALERIMAESPVPVLLLSSQTSEGAEVTLRGLELGAMDFVDKSRVQGPMNLLSLTEELRVKVRALAGARRPRERGPAVAPGAIVGHLRPGRAEAVLIGASTGGPPALQAIIPRLPENLGA